MSTSEVKKANMEHLKTFGTSREPLLTGIASEYDISLFRKAQVNVYFTQYGYKIDQHLTHFLLLGFNTHLN